MVVGEVVEVGKVVCGKGTYVFEVYDGETIRTSGTRVAAVPDSPGDVWGVEVCAGRVEGARLNDMPPDTAGVGVGGVGDDGGELFAEGRGYVFVLGKGTGVEGDRLVGRGGGCVVGE